MSRLTLWIIVGVVIVLAAGVVFVTQVPKILDRSGILPEVIERQESLLGNLSVRLAAGQLEIHKLRHGRYPPSLRELEFTNELEEQYMTNVGYLVNGEGTAYRLWYRGFTGVRREPTVPAEYWEGTGFDPELTAEDE